MTIDENNYEQYLLSYMDGELEKSELPALLGFLREHPDKQKELGLLEMTRLPQEKVISFPDKQSLYRTERRPVVKGAFMKHYGWIGAAAAAVFVGLFFIFNARNPDGRNPVAVSLPQTQKSVTVPEKSNQIPEKASQQKKPANEPGSLPAVVKTETPPAPESRIATHKNPVKNQLTVAVRKSPAGVAPTVPGPADIAIKKIRKEQREPALEKTDASLKDIPLPEISVPKEMLAANRETPAGKTSEGEGVQGTALVPISEKEPASAPRKRNEGIAMNKQAIDNAITERVADIQYKVSHPFGFLKGKEIKIGNVSFAFNK